MDMTALKAKTKEKKDQTVGFVRRHWKVMLWGLIGVAAVAWSLSSKQSDEEINEADDNLYKGGINDMKFSSKWFRNATDDELASEREKVRERYVDGTIDIDEADKLYDTLHRFDSEMIGRANSKYEKENPDSKPRHREHGWYLPNDED